jgi:hypothetical protein
VKLADPLEHRDGLLSICIRNCTVSLASLGVHFRHAVGDTRDDAEPEPEPEPDMLSQSTTWPGAAEACLDLFSPHSCKRGTKPPGRYERDQRLALS